MSTRLVVSAAEQIEEMKRLLGLSTDGDLAEALGLRKTAVAQWRRRNSVPERATLKVANMPQPMPRGDYEDALPSVVGMHALMLALLLTPSREQLSQPGRSEEIMSSLTDAASFFDELRTAAALYLLRELRTGGGDVDAAFGRVLASPSTLNAIAAAISG